MRSDSVLHSPIRAVCFDWGGTLMSELFGAADLPMAKWREVAVIDGIEDCLKALHGQYPLCVATNASVSNATMIKQALARVGLDRYFEHYFCAADLYCYKDQPQFWKTVTQTLNLPAPEILMVGDSLMQDVLAPKRFGIQTVWYNPNQQHASDKTILSVKNWAEFLRLISE